VSVSRSSGFTLIEILVVLMIVSIMSGVVIANMPSLTRTSGFEAEVKRLQILMELAREEALMQSNEFGFRLDRDGRGRFSGYSFYIYDDLNQSWTSYEVPPFHPRELPEGVELRLAVEGEGLRLDGDDDDGLPPVMLLSSGETTPFDLTIFQGRDLSETLRSDGYTRIEKVDLNED
jgi:general secretion pathway protein H